MDNLKKYAGLLNEVAPEGEFLAYINNDEEKMLRKAGGKGVLLNQVSDHIEEKVAIKVVAQVLQVLHLVAEVKAEVKIILQ